ncbi:hypothetical protein J3F83DRAFT_721934 [Trichoderma novae-zelandiae]
MSSCKLCLLPCPCVLGGPLVVSSLCGPLYMFLCVLKIFPMGYLLITGVCMKHVLCFILLVLLLFHFVGTVVLVPVKKKMMADEHSMLHSTSGC